MLHLFFGTDRAKARAAMMAGAEKGKSTTVVRVTDANAIADLSTSLAGRGMFDTGARSIVLEGTMQNQDMRQVVIAALPAIKDSDEHYYIYEEKPDAATRRTLEKYAETTEKFDALKQREDTAIFALKGALQQGDKKKLWIGIERELIAGKSAEAVHGFLFWAAKDMVLRGAAERGKKFVALLAALPHEARRRGEELEYALERFVLTEV